MQVSVEKVNAILRRLTIVVPAEQIDAAYAKQIHRFTQQANIKGFRPGKVPVDVIKKRYGEDARKEALGDVMQQAFRDAIIAQNLKPVSQPHVEAKAMLPDQPFEFVASFEILPEIEQIKFTLAKIDKLAVSVSQEDVNRVVEQLCKQHTNWKLVDRAAQEKDRVVIDYHAIFEGQVSAADNKVTSYSIELGSKQMIPGFEQGLMGAKAGEERTLNLHFPADFNIKDKAGKPVDFVVLVKEIYVAEIPEMSADFVKKLGVKSGKEQELKDQVKQSLEHERDRLVKEKLKEQIFQHLLEQNPLDVPQSMVAQEAKNIHDEIYPQHEHHDHHQHSDTEMTTFNDIAKKRVMLSLLMAEYAKKTKIKADEQRVQKRIEEIASVYENPKEVVTWLSTKEQRAGIESQVVEDQIIDKLMEGVPVTEKTMSYGELKGYAK